MIARRVAGLILIGCMVLLIDATSAQAAPVRRNGAFFDPSVVCPCNNSEATGIRKLIDAKQYRHAWKQAQQQAQAARSLQQRGRFWWLAAQAALASKASQRAERMLNKLAQSAHPLKQWAALLHAEQQIKTKPKRAAKQLAKLSRQHWSGRYRAQKAELKALEATGNRSLVIAKLRAMVGPQRHDIEAGLAMRLATLLSEQSSQAQQLEALLLYRRVAIHYPHSATGKEAEKAAQQLLQKLPAKVRARRSELTPTQQFERATALYNAKRYKSAEKAFDQLLQGNTGSNLFTCRAELMRGKAILRQRDRKRAAPLLEEVAEHCSGAQVRPAAYYHAGKARVTLGHNEQAITIFDRLANEYPRSNLADDALLLSAVAAQDAGRADAFIKRLEQLPTRFPRGDMVDDARFRLAQHARNEGDYHTALRHLEDSLTATRSSYTEGQEGRIAYWHARTLANMGMQDNAAEAYQRLIDRFPLSYHAQQALVRLEELRPVLASSIREEMRNRSSCAPIRFEQQALFNKPAFRTVIELFRVGETNKGRAALKFLKLTQRGATQDALWLAATLLHAAGKHAESSKLVRQRLFRFRHRVPSGIDWSRWRIAYPNAYHPLIEENAELESIPAAFMRAVAREESAFNPKAVSIAHAYGLLQMIIPTARKHARELRLPSTPHALKQPTINLRIGARLMRALWDRYSPNPAVLPASYNAGTAAADRWLKERGHMPLDAWVEAIPYHETRRYTRRVLQSYGVYSWLNHQRLPPLPSQLPTP